MVRRGERVMEKSLYPFTAIVGQEKVKKALLLNVISPSIGGTLLSGEKGTAKSTIVRSLAQLFPQLKVVTMPLNATEDRVVGSINIEKAIKNGKKIFESGILAKAHGNILYIDEVNLLSESLINTILDAASSGVNIVEREGVSYKHPCEFILVGTMNPEEGALKPQILDRFGFFVEVKGSINKRERIEIINKRIEFEKDSLLFYSKYKKQQEELSIKIEEAKKKVSSVKISNEILQIIAKLNLEAFTAGHRGDIALTLGAKAKAAFDGRNKVNLSDVKAIADLALAHRFRNPPELPSAVDENQTQNNENQETSNENNQKNEEKIDNRMNNDFDDNLDKNFDDFNDEDIDVDGTENNNDINNPPDVDEEFEIGNTFKVKDFLGSLIDNKVRNQGSGRRSKTRTSSKMGRYVKYKLPKGRTFDIALDATLRAAAPFQSMREKRQMAITIYKEDIKEKVREKRIGNTILFLVDASGSMGVKKRMVEAKGAIFSLLRDAYEKRDTVGMMTFRGENADLILHPTRSIDLAYKKLKDIKVGGKTPLALGLKRSVDIIKSLKVKNKDIMPIVVLISDGRGNITMKGNDPIEEVKRIAKNVSKENIQFVVVDTETGFIRLELAKKLCDGLGGIYFKLEELEEGQLASTIKSISN